MRSPSVWATSGPERRAYSADRSPARIAKQETVGPEPYSSVGEYRADRPGFQGVSAGEALFAYRLIRYLD